MSLHEIYWRLQKIGLRINSEREFKASLHGLKLESNSPMEKNKPIELSAVSYTHLTLPTKRIV